MSEELKITKDRVLKAAKCCEQTEHVLKDLFPELFAEKKSMDLEKNTGYLFANELMKRKEINQSMKEFGLAILGIGFFALFLVGMHCLSSIVYDRFQIHPFAFMPLVVIFIGFLFFIIGLKCKY